MKRSTRKQRGMMKRRKQERKGRKRRKEKSKNIVRNILGDWPLLNILTRDLSFQFLCQQCRRQYFRISKKSSFVNFLCIFNFVHALSFVAIKSCAETFLVFLTRYAASIPLNYKEILVLFLYYYYFDISIGTAILVEFKT